MAISYTLCTPQHIFLAFDKFLSRIKLIFFFIVRTQSHSFTAQCLKSTFDQHITRGKDVKRRHSLEKKSPTMKSGACLLYSSFREAIYPNEE